jgi:hypothetical protein
MIIVEGKGEKRRDDRRFWTTLVCNRYGDCPESWLSWNSNVSSKSSHVWRRHVPRLGRSLALPTTCNNFGRSYWDV